MAARDLEPDADWRGAALCKGKPELFFGPPSENEFPKSRRENEARALCATCPSIEPCRDWARTHREAGFWAGETELDRARLGFVCADGSMHLSRDRRRAAKRELRAAQAVAALSSEEIEALARLIKQRGDT